MKRWTAALLSATFIGCATAQPPQGGTMVEAPIDIGGREYVAEWHLPVGEPQALVTVQHGFARACRFVRETSRRIMERGVATLCVNAPMAGGNPALAEALAVTLLSGLALPDGRAMPQGFIVGGHSAGGHFASRLGFALDSLAPARLAGAVLYDPVAADASFTDNLMRVSQAGQRPVLAISANPGGCNANNNAYPALRQLRQDAIGAGRDGFVGLQLTDRSTHVDVEGGDTNLLGIVACRQGPPRAYNVESLRTLAGAWVNDLVAGTRDPAYYPGGSYVDALIGAGDATPIE